MDTPFMNTIARGLADHEMHVVRFEFPYMAQRRISGKQRPPNRPPILLQTWRDVIESLQPRRLIIGGKSMGGRIASMIAAEDDTDSIVGVVCLGYPFHPVGKPDNLRIEHLQTMTTPTLILQGQRDPFGKEQEVASYSLSNTVQIHWLTDGDHGFKPRKAAGTTLDANLAEAVRAIVDFETQVNA
jgi:predicted alpha/beta-hydrolase family hydrolase